MDFAVGATNAGRPKILGRRPDIHAPSCALHLLHKILKLAISLISIRVISAFGFVTALWICPVQIFANLGVYLAATNLAALAVFGRYELLVISAADERKCADAVQLCILTGALSVTATFVVAISVQHQFPSLVTLSFVGALFSRAWLRLSMTIATRNGNYERATKALLPHAIGQPIVLVYLIYMGLDPFLAFVLSDFFGQTIAASCVFLSERTLFSRLLWQPIRLQKISDIAWMHLELPTLNLTAAASAFLFATAPLLLLPSLSNGILAGTLALLFRLLDVPTNVTSASLTPVLMKEIADRSRRRVLWVSRGAFLLPAAVALVVFGLISLCGLTLNILDLAPRWHMALTILPVVALFQAGIAATAPLIDIAMLAGRQKWLFSLNVVSFVLAGLSLIWWAADPIFAIFIAGSIGSARVLAMSILLVKARVNQNSSWGVMA